MLVLLVAVLFLLRQLLILAFSSPLHKSSQSESIVIERRVSERQN